MDALLPLLPHRPPVRFVKTVLASNEQFSMTLVQFDTTPSLAMVVEAAAQSSVFIKIPTKSNIGMLVVMKNIKYHEPLLKETYQIKTELLHYLDQYFMFKFTLFDENKKNVTGEFNIVGQ